MTGREVLVPSEEKDDLAAMMRDYIAEMARIIAGIDPAQPYAYLDLYWSEPDSRWPFWLLSDDVRAGFALLDREGETMQIAEFFVVPAFRRAGIGLAAARRLIARSPGPWQITQRAENTGAIAFWHRVLDGFVTYKETTTRTDAVRREQTFVYP